MAANTCTLDQCITQYLQESEQGDYKYAKCWDIACRGMEEMGLDYFYRIKSVKVPVNPNKTVQFPNDYIQYSKIGVLNSQSEIIVLKYNDKFTYYADLSPDRIQVTRDDSLFNFFQFGSIIFYNYWDGSNYINLFGLPSGEPSVGSFKIDEANDVILLEPYFHYDYLIIEYLASPNTNITYRIPIQFRPPMISYLRWKDVLSVPSSTHVSNNEKGIFRHEYFEDLRKGWERANPLDFLEAYEQSLRQQRYTIRT